MTLQTASQLIRNIDPRGFTSSTVVIAQLAEGGCAIAHAESPSSIAQLLLDGIDAWFDITEPESYQRGRWTILVSYTEEDFEDVLEYAQTSASSGVGVYTEADY